MAEKTTVPMIHKPFRLIYAFIKWTTVAISLLLLILGLFLAAPWKVLLIFSVIPVVGIFMPHDLQKWCWIAMAAIVIVIYLWIRIPEQDSSQWHPYVFEQKISSFLSRESIPDPDNAAIQYETLFARHEEDLFAYPMDQETDAMTYHGPWDETTQPELARWLKTIEPDFAVLADIAKIPGCRFSPPVDIVSLHQQLKRIHIMKVFIRDMLRSANQDLSHGQLSAAMDKQLTTMRLAQHLWQQGTLLDQDTGYFLEQMARRSAGRLVIDYAADSNILHTIEQAWNTADSRWPDCWKKVLESEKMLTVGLTGMFYQQNDQGHIRYSRNIAEGLRRHMNARFSKYALSSERSRMIALAMGLAIPAEPEGTAYLIEKRFDRLSEMALSGIDIKTKVSEVWIQDGLNASAAIDWYACQQVSYYYPLNTQNLQFEQNRAIINTLIALKRYQSKNGDWPDALQQAFGENPIPADPVSQKPFVYKKQNDTFVLYGIGKNGTDDGGIKDPYTKQDDTLFWPTAGSANGEE